MLKWTHLFGALLCLLMVLAVCATAPAGETAHYCNGIEGLKAATMPPPGFYSRNYFAYYHADDMTDENGDELDLDFQLDVSVWVTRLCYVTNHKFLGADYGMHLIAGLEKVDLEMNALNVEDEDVGFCDLALAPVLLGWHLNQWDISLGYEIFFPVGEYDITEPASTGKDMWTHMLDFGATYYFDKDKLWHASALGRFEIHSEKDDSDVRPGNDLHFEWGVGRTFKKTWDVGIAGYCQWQVSDDKGSDVVWDEDIHDRVFGIGPEISYFHVPTKLQMGLRHIQEFGARDRSEGHITCLTIMKVF
ncbi:MAG: transporter [Planctomycetes bacterium]|nr:transporter [Planctomycetota bacterium]